MTTDRDGADLRATMNHVLQDTIAPDGIDRTAIAQGRRLGRRRRTAIAAASVAAVAAAGALSLPFVGGSNGARDDTPVANSPSMSQQPSGGEAPSPDDTASSEWQDNGPPTGWWSRPGAQMLSELERLLPPGVTVTSSRSTDGSVDGVLTGPSGSGRFQLMLQPPRPTSPAPVTTTGSDGSPATEVAGAQPSLRNQITCGTPARWSGTVMSCRILRDRAGAKTGVVATHLDGGTTYHFIELLGPDDGGLHFYVADSTGEKPGYRAPTADAPPLTVTQVRALAQNPIWTTYQP